jgi:Cdc6-like AAA superfamily ATPase
MIRDGTVFDDDHLPREIVGRNSHMNEVTTALAPIEQGEQAENCFLFGPSGVGKTTVARASVRELRKEVLEVPYAYVNCWQNYTKNAVLMCLAQDLVDAAVARNASNRQLTKTNHQQNDSPALVILDEVDQLSETEVLYDLHQISGVSWIAVANREIDLFAGLEERVHSRMSVGFRVMFNAYDDDTITEILDRRAREGLGSSVVSRDVLARIARLADGDARTAITALRVAARKSTQAGLSSIPARIVEESVFAAGEEVRRKTISKLNQHQRVIYEVLESEGSLIQKDLYERYSEAHNDPVTLRYLRQKHLPKHDHYGLVKTERKGSGKLYILN